MAVKTRWEGNASLKRRLRPVDDLHTHPMNARRGDLPAIAASLERFGQQRAVLALEDGTIVAGNHTFMAARDVLGWSHVAAEPCDLSDREIDAYLIADNRTADLGTYDLPMLASLLHPFGEDLHGLGFTPDDYEHLIQIATGVEVPEPVTPPKPEGVATLFLTYPKEDHERLTRWLAMVAREWGVDVEAVVLRMAQKEAAAL